METLRPLAFLICALAPLSVKADPLSWGQNDRGQLGDATTANHGLPAAVLKTGVLAGKKVVDIAGGEVHSLALTSDGKLYAWGYNLFGQVGDGTSTDRTQPVAVDMSGVMAGKTVTAIAAGVHQCMALTTDGKLYSWGINDGGVLGDNTTTPRHAPVAVNMSGALAGKTATAICEGEIHCMALTSEGKVYAWGSNLYGQLGDGTNSNRGTPVAVSATGVLAGKTVIAINNGRFHSLALTSEGKLYAWGLNDRGQLGDGTTTNRNVPVAVNMTGALAGKLIQSMDGGYSQTLALTTDGKLFGWGLNDRGQLADGTTTDRPLPVASNMSGALTGKTVVDVRTRRDHCLALTSDGKLYSWGYNSAGQLGDGTTTLRNLPGLVPLPGKTVTAIDAGSRHSLIEAIAPEIAVEQPAGTPLTSGGTVNFGTVILRSSATRDFVIKNTGPDPLTVSGITWSGTGSGDFLLTSTQASVIPPGGSGGFSMRFAPGTAGTRTAVLQIASDDSDESPFNITLTGTGLAVPEIEIHDGPNASSPQLVDGAATVMQFPVVRQGSPAERDLTITNTGTAALNITGAVLPPGYSAVNLPFLPAVIPPDNSISFRLRLNAAAPGTFAGSVAFANNDGDEAPFDFLVSGTVITPEIALFDGTAAAAPEVFAGQQTPVNFGTTRQATPVIRTLRIANTGSDRLLVNGFTVPAGFTVLNAAAYPAAVEIGGTLLLNVRLNAAAPGTFAGMASLLSDDFDEARFEFPLTGTVITPEIVLYDGTAAGPELADGQAAPVDFGTTRQATPVVRSFTIANTGTAPLLISGIVPPAGFVTLNAPALPAIVGTGAALTLQVQLTATALGPFSGNVSIASDDLDEAAFDFPVTGLVVSPEIVLHNGDATAPELTDGQAAPVDFGRNVQGTPGSRTVTIANAGTADLLVSSMSVPTGYMIQNPPVLPLTIGIGQTTAFQLSLTTLTPGTHAGSVVIVSDDLDEASFAFPVTGEVFIPGPIATLPAATATLNRQTGLREQTIRLGNDTTATVPAYNLIIRGLPAGVEVNNASSQREDGSWVVYVRRTMNPHTTQDVLLEYFSPTRLPAEFTPQLSTEVVLVPPDLSVPGEAAAFRIDVVKSVRGGVLIEFPTTPGSSYQVQYSSDGTHWQSSLPSIRAAANRTQWVDRGLPRTDSAPVAKTLRFYRVVLLP